MKISHHVNIDPKSISNIIFDWGGVITNINYNLTVEAFDKIGHNSFQNFFNQYHQDEIFKKFEKGEIDENEIYNSIRKVIGRTEPDESIKYAWCAMLLDIPFPRITLLKKIAENYAIFLLSNTNKIHVEYYLNEFRKNYSFDFKSLFKKVYYSHEIGMRKPDSEIFNFVLSDSHLEPSRTLYLDDTEINVTAAANAGMHTIYLTKQDTIEKIFEKWVE